MFDEHDRKDEELIVTCAEEQQKKMKTFSFNFVRDLISGYKYRLICAKPYNAFYDGIKLTLDLLNSHSS